jgi:hypothetical protein
MNDAQHRVQFEKKKEDVIGSWHPQNLTFSVIQNALGWSYGPLLSRGFCHLPQYPQWKPS